MERGSFLHEFFGSVNEAFFGKDNIYTAVKAHHPIGPTPNVTELEQGNEEITVTFVRGVRSSGASASIMKGYSRDKIFGGSLFPLAVKQMHYKDVSQDDPPEFYKLVDREVAALEELCAPKDSHPLLIKFFGPYFQPELNEHWLVFEYCDGGSVQFMTSQPVNFDHIAAVAAGTLEGLAEIHRRGFIHADIKPENLLLKSPGIIKICDFGLAAKVEGVEDPELHALGTVRYMSPELMLKNVLLDRQDAREAGYVYDAKTDIWSLGVVLLELVLGRVPLYSMRKLEETVFCEYIMKMSFTKKKVNRGSGLLQFFLLRESYEKLMQRNNVETDRDIASLRRKFPILREKPEVVVKLLDKQYLSGDVNPSAPVPNIHVPGLFAVNKCFDFIAQCLICGYEKRPSAEALKEHQFVRAPSREFQQLLPSIPSIISDNQESDTRKLLWKKYRCIKTIQQLNEVIETRKKCLKERLRRHSSR